MDNVMYLAYTEVDYETCRILGVFSARHLAMAAIRDCPNYRDRWAVEEIELDIAVNINV